jgi:hypothetical protein
MRQAFGLAGMIVLAVMGRAAPLGAAGQVREIPANWSAAEWRRVSVAGAQASSVYPSESGQYAASRAVDGNRGTKWVASVAPSQVAPQWITLDLFGVQKVSALAVFGGPNDNIRDAQVQVASAKGGPFTTVATIRDAQPVNWLVAFDATPAAQLRLLITRSGGPSPHTDVNEIELFGPPMSNAELKRYATARLAAGALPAKAAVVAAEKPQLSHAAGFCEAVAAMEQQRRQTADQLARWDALSESDRQTLVATIERLQMQPDRLMLGMERATALWPKRAAELAAARQAARTVAGENAVCIREGGRLRLGNRWVCVVVDEAGGTWDATWLGGVDAAVRQARFAIEADAETLAPRGAKAESLPVADAIGHGWEIRQRWGRGVEVERRIRVYDGKPAVLIAVQMTNHTKRDVKLGNAKMLDVSAANGGWWHLVDLLRAPAAASYGGGGAACRPAPDEELATAAQVQYGSTGVLALVGRGSAGGMAVGGLSAREGWPHVHAEFRAGEGGTSLGIASGFDRNVLPAGETIVLDSVWLSVEENRYDALERYGDAMAALSPKGVRRGANALWSSWYPIRMQISEEIALAHAAIVAKHFQPLGMDTIHLDHGWQRGAICGDWTPDKRFPHGLKWLADELRSRYGLKLGLWSAPSCVSFTSQMFREHPEFLDQDAQGKPKSYGRWFWVPHPETAHLDACRPGAAQWIQDTYARLAAEGVSYFYIDFMSGSPASMKRTMTAIRQGTGPNAWIRYSQTPMFFSLGLASSDYTGADTGDAGIAGWMDLLRQNAPQLAASYWINDRLCHREICETSVGNKASVEEARFRLALLTLSGCSICLSDDFRLLDLPRIRMMQQCLPPGNPLARPLDLFERQLPSLWHMHCANNAGEWDVVGLFNFEDQPQQRTVALSALGLPAGSKVTVFEFWEEKLLGTYQDQVALMLAPRTARILLIHRQPLRPQVIATNMHVLGGYHEIQRMAWDDQQLVLSGTYRRAAGLDAKAYLYVPDGYRPLTNAPGLRGLRRLVRIDANLWAEEVQFQNAQVDWAVPFERSRANR